jgi:hypothetical protein
MKSIQLSEKIGNLAVILTMVPSKSIKTKNLIEKRQNPKSSGRITSLQRL